MYKIVNMKSWFWWLLVLSLCFSITLSIDGTSNIYNMTTAEAQSFDWGAHPATIVAIILYFIISVWVTVVYSWRTSKVFGHGVGYTIGLILLPNIFWLILGFDKSKYNKKNLK